MCKTVDEETVGQYRKTAEQGSAEAMSAKTCRILLKRFGAFFSTLFTTAFAPGGYACCRIFRCSLKLSDGSDWVWSALLADENDPVSRTWSFDTIVLGGRCRRAEILTFTVEGYSTVSPEDARQLAVEVRRKWLRNSPDGKRDGPTGLEILVKAKANIADG